MMYIYHRFTDRSRSVMKLAQQEALKLGGEHIATEHILLALAEEGVGVAGHVLRSIGAGPSQIRSEINKIVQSTVETTTDRKLPLSAGAHKVIEDCHEEARALDHLYVGTEHLLLSLVRQPESGAAQLLTRLGLKHEDVRKAVLSILGHNIPTEGQS